MAQLVRCVIVRYLTHNATISSNRKSLSPPRGRGNCKASRRFLPSPRWRGARVQLFVAEVLDRTAVLALFGGVAIDELDDGQRRIVAVAVAGVEHAGIAGVAGP